MRRQKYEGEGQWQSSIVPMGSPGGDIGQFQRRAARARDGLRRERSAVSVACVSAVGDGRKGNVMKLKADVGRCQATVRLKSTNVLERHRPRGGNNMKEKGAGRAVSCRYKARGGAVRRHASVRLKSTDSPARHRQRGDKSIKEKGDGRVASCRCEARGGDIG